MTVCGFARTPGGEILVWADSEVYRDHAPCGSRTKLVTSPSGLVGVATGYNQLCEHFDEFVTGSGSMAFSDAVSRLPALLRARVAAKRRDNLDDGRPYDYDLGCALVGYGNGATRGAIFLEARGFNLIEADTWMSPYVAGRPQSAAEVLRFAQAQIGYVQQQYPTATGLSLTVARVGAGKVTKAAVPLLLGDERNKRGAAATPAPSGAAYASQSPAHLAAVLRDAEVRRRLGLLTI